MDASTAVASVTACSARYPVEESVAGSCTWRMFATTASASNGVPSVKVTPWRSVSSSPRPSSLQVQPSASHGVIPPFPSSDTSGSRNWDETSACG